MDSCALIFAVNTTIRGLLGRAVEGNAILREAGNGLSADTVQLLRDLKTHQNRYENLRPQVARLLSAAVRRTDDLLVSCYGTLFVEIWTRVLPQGRSLLALDSQAGNTIHLITLTKSIYNTLTYIIYKFTFYGYEANKSISRDTDSDPDVGCRSFASSLFALFHCFFVYNFLPFFIFIFFIYFLLYLLHLFFILFPFLYFLFHLSLFVSFNSSFFTFLLSNFFFILLALLLVYRAHSSMT